MATVLVVISIVLLTISSICLAIEIMHLKSRVHELWKEVRFKE